jgi:hypothetical protein
MNERREVTYFTDRDLGRKLPETLKASGLRVETHDARIRYSPLALRVLMQTGARLFVLVGNLTTAECADLIVKSRKQIEALASSEAGAFIAKIRRDGVHLWIRERDWKRRHGA